MMKLLTYKVFGVFGTLVLFSVSAAGGNGNEYNRGKNLYEEKCQICHGVKGEGDGPAASALNPSPADFGDPQFWQKNGEKTIVNTIRKGKGPMPSFDLDEDDVKAVIEYMDQAFRKK